MDFECYRGGKGSVRIHTYVIATDAGSAPNYESPFVTLAVCKPRIRKKVKDGELVLAFAGRNVNPDKPHTVVWAGLVKEKMSFAEYWHDRRFRDKKPDRSDHPDNFYRPMNGGFVWVPNDVHGVDALAKDTGGQYVRSFSPAWRFGANGPALPADFGLRMTTRRRGECAVDIGDTEWWRLRDWLNQNLAGIKVERSPARGCVPRRKVAVSAGRPKRKGSC